MAPLKVVNVFLKLFVLYIIRLFAFTQITKLCALLMSKREQAKEQGIKFSRRFTSQTDRLQLLQQTYGIMLTRACARGHFAPPEIVTLAEIPSGLP